MIQDRNGPGPKRPWAESAAGRNDPGSNRPVSESTTKKPIAPYFSTKMADEDLETIRARRMAELQGQYGVFRINYCT